MKIRRTVFAALAILLAWCSVAAASFAPPILSAQELLQAPMIVTGQVIDLQPGPPIADEDGLASCTAQVRVGVFLKGSAAPGALSVRLARDVSGFADGGQALDAGANYVFFLSPAGGTGQMRGIQRFQFAIPTENVPIAELQGVEADQALRTIAQANLEAKSEEVAVRWCNILGDLYRDQDRDVLGKVTSDRRWLVRGTACCVLCEHSDLTSATYAQATALLEGLAADRSAAPTSMWRVDNNLFLSSRVCSSLRKYALRVPPSAAQMHEWVESDIPQLQFFVMEVIRGKRAAPAVSDVVALMQRTKERDLQYQCFMAVGILDGTTSHLSRDEFTANADRHVQEVLARHPDVTPAP